MSSPYFEAGALPAQDLAPYHVLPAFAMAAEVPYDLLDPSFGFGGVTPTTTPHTVEITPQEPAAPDLAPAVTTSENVAVPEGVEPVEKTWMGRTREFASRNKTRLMLGTAAVSTAVTLTTNPLGHVAHEVFDSSIVAAVGAGVSESLFIGGGALMAVSAGRKIGNPLKLRERLPEICEHTNNSAVFKTGFVANATGAFGTTAIVGAGVLFNLPPSAWPILLPAAADLYSTYAFRKVLIDGIRKGATTREAQLAALNTVEGEVVSAIAAEAEESPQPVLKPEPQNP